DAGQDCRYVCRSEHGAGLCLRGGAGLRLGQGHATGCGGRGALRQRTGDGAGSSGRAGIGGRGLPERLDRQPSVPRRQAYGDRRGNVRDPSDVDRASTHGDRLMCKLVPPLVAALIAFAAPAMAEDGPRYDAGGFARCIADAKAGTDIDAALNNCIGGASTQCMATPGGDTTVGMSQCLESETRDWDKLLNINYARALKVAEAADKELAELGSAASPAAPELRKAQRNWRSEERRVGRGGAV